MVWISFGFREDRRTQSRTFLMGVNEITFSGVLWNCVMWCGVM